MASIISLLQAAIVFGTVIMLGSCGEILMEKTGNLNLGVPGVMYIGGISSLAGVFIFQLKVRDAIAVSIEKFVSAGGNSADWSPSGILKLFSQRSDIQLNGWDVNGIVGMVIAIVCTIIGSVIAGLIFSFLTITLRANQNVTGLTLTIFGSGIANFYGGSLNKLAGGVGQISVSSTSEVFRARIPFLSKIDVVGDAFFSYGFLVYVAIIVAVLLQIFLNHTRKGLNLRAVGENPGTADAAGINVTKYKYCANCVGSAIIGMGGLFFVMDYTKGTWANDGSIEKLGWLAVALVIFTTWKTVNSIWGAYLFGILYWMFFYISGLSRSSQEIFKMLPYIVTILVLIFISFRKKKENQPPAGLGIPYFREER